jgi:hypothetical protein
MLAPKSWFLHKSDASRYALTMGFLVFVQSLVSTYSNDKLLRGQFSFSGKDSNGEPW